MRSSDDQKPSLSRRREADIVAVLMALDEGEVVSYGDVATTAGHPRQSRLVGRILSERSAELDLPWWRVVNASGRLVPGHEKEQIRRLVAEGVVVGPSGRVSRTSPSPGRKQP